MSTAPGEDTPFPATGSEWPRLARAIALVVFGLAVHTWIGVPRSTGGDVPTPAGPLPMADPVTDNRGMTGVDTQRAVGTGGSDDTPASPHVGPVHVRSVQRSAPAPAMMERVRVTDVLDPDGVRRPKHSGAIDAQKTVEDRPEPVPDVPVGDNPAPLGEHGVAAAVDTSLVTAARVDTHLLPAVAMASVAIPPSPTRLAAVSRVGAPLLAGPMAEDHESVLRVLRDYETAVERLDVRAAKAVWPSVDQRALGRAFSGLSSHSLALENCGVTVAGEEAQANCRGVATYLPKVGRRKPLNATHEWTFTLSKAQSGWEIASLHVR